MGVAKSLLPVTQKGGGGSSIKHPNPVGYGYAYLTTTVKVLYTYLQPVLLDFRMCIGN